MTIYRLTVGAESIEVDLDGDRITTDRAALQRGHEIATERGQPVTVSRPGSTWGGYCRAPRP